MRVSAVSVRRICLSCATKIEVMVSVDIASLGRPPSSNRLLHLASHSITHARRLFTGQGDEKPQARMTLIQNLPCPSVSAAAMHNMVSIALSQSSGFRVV